jgi:hypothetical protein
LHRWEAGSGYIGLSLDYWLSPLTGGLLVIERRCIADLLLLLGYSLTAQAGEILIIDESLLLLLLLPIRIEGISIVEILCHFLSDLLCLLR